MWEHKQDIYEDDSLRSENSKDESNLSEVNEQENTSCGQSESVPQDVSNTRVAGEARDTSDSKNGESESELKNGEEVVKNKDVNKLREEQTVQESKRLNTGTSHDKTGGDEKQTAQDSEDSLHLNNDQELNEKKTANDISVGDGKISTLEAKGGAENTASNEGATENNNEIVKGGNMPMKGKDSAVQDEKRKYSGDDLAFINLLEEVEDDQTFFDEQLDRVEKQVESKCDVLIYEYL